MFVQDQSILCVQYIKCTVFVYALILITVENTGERQSFYSMTRQEILVWLCMGVYVSVAY